MKIFGKNALERLIESEVVKYIKEEEADSTDEYLKKSIDDLKKSIEADKAAIKQKELKLRETIALQANNAKAKLEKEKLEKQKQAVQAQMSQQQQVVTETEGVVPSPAPAPAHAPVPAEHAPKKIYKVKFDTGTQQPFEVKFTERGFLVDGTRLSFEFIESALGKEINLHLAQGQGLLLDQVRMQKILKYKDRF